jgi:methyltransferase-like protein/2-polyprenyl-3-methyl-5-hydroxy-6-metoxy-1,4-benzoquinol methylase
MASNDIPNNPYDLVPYPSSSYPQTHPSRLAGIARLFGAAPRPLRGARVLELGCADGANVLPMADHAPEMSFLGVDASKTQIESGLRAIAAGGAKNVELRVQDLAAFPESEGKFDYIIAHGIYSWVPEPVREKILEICDRHLTEEGIAYVSYNALPGWNMRRSLREMMRYHTRAFSEPQAKVQQARALLKFLSTVVPAEGAYGLMLRQELKLVSEREDNYILHDFLESVNDGFYFHQFIERAGRHGLKYVGEPSVAQMLAANFPEAVQKTLNQIGTTIVAQEQYIDFLINRTFRQTILCRKSQKLNRNIDDIRIRTVCFQSTLKPTNVSLAAQVPVQFETTRGAQITASDPFLKAVFKVLADSRGASAFSFDQLLAAAQQLLAADQPTTLPNGAAAQEKVLALNLTNLVSKGFVEVHAEPISSETTVPDRPLLSPLTRYMAMNYRWVTNRTHTPSLADIFVRNVIDVCDGSRSQADIVATMIERAQQGAFIVSEEGAPVSIAARLHEVIAPRVAMTLQMLTQGGMFAPSN